jgi:hypothetical protein
MRWVLTFLLGPTSYVTSLRPGAYLQGISVMQEHRSKPATCQPASTSSVHSMEGERRNPLIFQILKIVLNVVRLVEPKAMHVRRL